MVLRASAQTNGEAVDLRGIVDAGVPLGIAGGEVLVPFADALLGNDAAALATARDAVRTTLGDDAVTAAAAIAANFSRNDRIANAIGIPLERDFVDQAADFRPALGIDAFRSARNTLDGT